LNAGGRFGQGATGCAARFIGLALSVGRLHSF
jgi:hypothetical protein